MRKGRFEMSIHDIPLFTWKSKKKKAKEMKEYAIWAFPHGQLQRGNLTKLLSEVFPGQSPQYVLISFLTCKELFDDALDGREPDQAIDVMINLQKSYKRIVKQGEMTTYLALVLADRQIDSGAQYPAAEEIHAHAAELEKLRKDEKK